MHDFVVFLADLLHSSLGVMLLTALIFGLGTLGVVFLRKKAGKPPMIGSWKKSALIVIFSVYCAFLFYVTLVRRDTGFYSINLHLFRAWREAWNCFSLKNWLNVLLNVALFLPLGFFLPLIRTQMQKWYPVILLGSILSLLIEILQYCCGLGVADVDDLFCNGLGTALGYCIVMALRHLKVRQCRQALPFLILPTLCAMTISGMCLFYACKDYGNLSLAPAYRMNTNGFIWDTDCTLSENRPQAAIYRAPSMNRKSCHTFGTMFFDRLGVEIHDISYYDASTYFANRNPGHFLFVNEQDGTYTYSNMLSVSESDGPSLSEEAVRAALAPFGVQIPEQAVFLSEGSNRYRFQMKQVPVPGGMYDGEVGCSITPTGEVCRIEHFLQQYEFWDTATLRSEQEAFDTIRKGWITHPMLEDHRNPVIRVHGVELEYRIDSKGFYQPVYIFSVSVNGVPLENGLLVPAL